MGQAPTVKTPTIAEVDTRATSITPPSQFTPGPSQALHEPPSSSRLHSPAPSTQTTHSQAPPPYTAPPGRSTGPANHSNLSPLLDLINARKQSRTASTSAWRDPAIRLRSLALFFSLVGILLFSICLPYQPMFHSDFSGAFIDVSGLGCLSYCAVASFIMLVSDLILRHQKKGLIHPAIPLTFDMFAWAGTFALFILICLVTSFTGYDDCDDDELAGRSCQYIGDTVTRLERTGMAFMAIVIILHFWIFVRACKAVHQERKELKEMKATLRAFVELA